MSEFHNSIAVVWPSSLPTSDPEAHCTMLYLGEIPDVHADLKAILLEELTTWDFQAPGDFFIRASNLYGPNHDVLVAELHDPKGVLAEQRGYLENGLAGYGIFSPSRFGFSPHVTIKPVAVHEEFSPRLTLSTPVLWWGDERPVFR